MEHLEAHTRHADGRPKVFQVHIDENVDHRQRRDDQGKDGAGTHQTVKIASMLNMQNLSCKRNRDDREDDVDESKPEWRKGRIKQKVFHSSDVAFLSAPQR